MKILAHSKKDIFYYVHTELNNGTKQYVCNVNPIRLDTREVRQLKGKNFKCVEN